jgi:phosphoglycerate dehydrogenase-like enzyme
MPKVLITPTTLAHADGPHLRVLREANLEWCYPSRPMPFWSEEGITAELKGVHAVIAGTEPYSRRVLEAAPELRVIARAGVGYDTVDVAAASDHGIAVAITPGANQDAVAEHTMTLLLGLAKRLVSQHLLVQKGEWPRQPTLPLRDRVLGIAGLGRIGKAVAVRASSFGMRLLAYEPYPDHAFVERYQVALVPFERLLAEADFLTLHLPLSPTTRHLINRQTLGQMKRGAFLINTARGGLVCEADLLEALRNKTIGGAGLDVFEKEPPGANPLFQQETILMTAHTAGVDYQSLEDMAVSASRAIASLSRGEWPAEQIVNPEAQAKFRWSK